LFRTVRVLTGPAVAGRQRTREKANVEHQRRFRGAAVTQTHAPLREAPFQGGHTEACHRLHKLSKRHSDQRPQLHPRRWRERWISRLSTAVT